MLSKTLPLGLLSLFISFAFAETTAVPAPAAPVPPTGEVIRLQGKVLFQDKEIKQGDKIDRPGKIEVKDKSFIQIKIDKWKNVISIGGNSTMNLNFSDEKKYTLEEGKCRWKSFAESESKGKIFTKNVSMGVRGTDFLLTYNPQLAETEIVMFDGVVHFENVDDKENAYDVKKGQWGGLGGRFGKKINQPIDLPPSLVESFNKVVE